MIHIDEKVYAYKNLCQFDATLSWFVFIFENFVCRKPGHTFLHECKGFQKCRLHSKFSIILSYHF